MNTSAFASIAAHHSITQSTPVSRAHRGASRRSLTRLVLVGVVSSALVIVGSGVASAAIVPVPLGTAESFVVLAGAGVDATGPNTLNGDLGTFPTTSITGAGSITVNGTNHAGDSVTQGAKDDLVTAYDVAAGEGPTSPIAADLAGLTLTPGIYNSASQIQFSGVLTLDAAGDPDALFVFQAGSDLTVASSASVVLINGAQACNVFWQVTSSATLGTGAAFKGNILALQSITLTTGATVEGRVLARNGAVTLDTNTITAPACTTVTGGTDGGTSGGSLSGETPLGGVSTGDGSAVSVSAGGDDAVPMVIVPVVLGVALAGASMAIAVRIRRQSSAA